MTTGSQNEHNIVHMHHLLCDTYGKDSNLTILEEKPPPATEDEKKYIQRVLGNK